ncbi:MAG: hypothetical protein ABSE35_05555 [Bryobacteraceae bacterium]
MNRSGVVCKCRASFSMSRPVTAIDPLLDAFGDAPQDAVGMIARFHEAAKLEILVALLFTQLLDLHQIGNYDRRLHQ